MRHASGWLLAVMLLLLCICQSCSSSTAIVVDDRPVLTDAALEDMLEQASRSATEGTGPEALQQVMAIYHGYALTTQQRLGVCVILAMLHYSVGDETAAIAFLQEAYEADPEHPDAWQLKQTLINAGQAPGQ